MVPRPHKAADGIRGSVAVMSPAVGDQKTADGIGGFLGCALRGSLGSWHNGRSGITS